MSLKMSGSELNISPDVVIHLGIYGRTITSAGDPAFLLIEAKNVFVFLEAAFYSQQMLTLETTDPPGYFLHDMLSYQFSSSLCLCN
jgi:hypothetical protein